MCSHGCFPFAPRFVVCDTLYVRMLRLCQSTLLLALVGAHWLQAAGPPPEYYVPCIGKRGALLRNALHEVIRSQTVIPYSSASFDTSDALKMVDADPAITNSVLLVYSLRPNPNTNFPSVWDREHLWPNSYGIDNSGPAYSDLHNLRPANKLVNSTRGNRFYDYSYPGYPDYRSPGHVEAAIGTAMDVDSWQAAPSERGDIARAMFYMDVRYEGNRSNEPDLVLTASTSRISTTNTLFGSLVPLLYWHFEDPVDDAERRRNDAVFAIQKNRNPFVDHPEWVAELFFPRLEIVPITPGHMKLRWPAQFTNNVVIIFDFDNPFPTETNGNFVPFGITVEKRLRHPGLSPRCPGSRSAQVVFAPEVVPVTFAPALGSCPAGVFGCLTFDASSRLGHRGNVRFRGVESKVRPEMRPLTRKTTALWIRQPDY